MSEEYAHDRVSAGEGQMVMPFYLICDVSYSMSRDMAALNDGVQRLRRSIVSEPFVDDVAHVSIMTFSDTAKVVMPLTQLSEQPMPQLSAEGGTNYGAAFRELAHVIPADAAALKAQGYKVFRPCAFFLTDGEPQDPDYWETFKATLTYNRVTSVGMRQHPAFIPFGFRQAPAGRAQEAGLSARARSVVPHRERRYRPGDQDHPRRDYEDGGLKRAELVHRCARVGPRPRAGNLRRDPGGSRGFRRLRPG